MGKSICLLYHSVSEVPNYYGISIAPELFEQHIKFLAENYDVQRLEDADLFGKEDSLIISFDDGYRDNYQYALPILTKYKTPATFFVSSGNIGTYEEYWWDELERLVYCSNNNTFHLVDPLYDYTWTIMNDKDRWNFVRDIHFLLRLDPSLLRWQEWRRQLIIWADADVTGRIEKRSMLVNELIEMSKNPYATIGGHTVTHRSLGCLSAMEQEYEIDSNIMYLEQLIGKEIEVFSYPFGTHYDYTDVTKEVLTRHGIKRSMTTERRAINIDDEFLELPRISVGDISVDQLSCLLEEEFNR